MSRDYILNLPSELVDIILTFLDQSSTFSLSLTAKKYRHYETISFIFYENIEDIHFDAIAHGYIDMFRWLVFKTEIILTEGVVYMGIAARYNQMEILKYIRIHFRDNGCYWGVHVSCNAAEYGHLEILKYLRTQFPENECERLWNDGTCTLAVVNGHLDVLKYLHENGCPLPTAEG